MRFIKKRNKADAQPAVWLVGLRSGIERKQRKVADWCSRRTQYWNRTSWLIALALFSLLFGGCCLLLCIKAFIHL
ncbi:hypothetical protein FHW88_000425 [Mucilaginibacter sp. SG538B]|uniref:hypothetical protein n=1 Tax=Mucilaginibacter sp. SG538B TaxID=2587021 RepID=UPI00159E2C1F|nr:hypothetical protein [Mucilaginibacter sp. SG538B]NVM62149.1 hypothetical protein [Mucilaginibacter sp. SG538B]